MKLVVVQCKFEWTNYNIVKNNIYVFDNGVVCCRNDFLRTEGVTMDNIQETEESEDEVTQLEDTKVRLIAYCAEVCLITESD